MRKNIRVILLAFLVVPFVVSVSACKEDKDQVEVESDSLNRFSRAFDESASLDTPDHEPEVASTASSHDPIERERVRVRKGETPTTPRDLDRMKREHRERRSSFEACEQIEGPDLSNSPELGDRDTGVEIGFIPMSGKGHTLDCFDAVKRPGTAHDFLITVLDNGGAGKKYEQDQIARGFWDGNGKRCNWGREDLEGPDCPICHPCSTPQGRSAWQCDVKDYEEDLFDGGVNETRIAIQERGAGETYIPTMDCASRLPNDNGETAYAVYFNQGPGVRKIPGESYIR